MDGSNAAFLFEDTLFSSEVSSPATSRSGGARNGILYIEDFDADPAPAREASAVVAEVVQFGVEDLEAARAAGYESGLQAALAEAEVLQGQLRTAAVQSLSDGLAASRGMLEVIAQTHADETARTMLAVLQAAIPAAMRSHAADELVALIRALAPGCKAEPELRVRAHPAMAEMVRELLSTVLPLDGCGLSVGCDEGLLEGDIRIEWKAGFAERNCGRIYAEIVAALLPLRLPDLKEICSGR